MFLFGNAYNPLQNPLYEFKINTKKQNHSIPYLQDSTFYNKLVSTKDKEITYYKQLYMNNLLCEKNAIIVVKDDPEYQLKQSTTVFPKMIGNGDEDDKEKYSLRLSRMSDFISKITLFDCENITSVHLQFDNIIIPIYSVKNTNDTTIIIDFNSQMNMENSEENSEENKDYPNNYCEICFNDYSIDTCIGQCDHYWCNKCKETCASLTPPIIDCPFCKQLIIPEGIDKSTYVHFLMNFVDLKDEITTNLLPMVSLMFEGERSIVINKGGKCKVLFDTANVDNNLRLRFCKETINFVYNSQTYRIKNGKIDVA